MGEIKRESIGNFDHRIRAMAQILASKDLLLNDQLESTQKNSFSWFALKLISPICSLFGYDVFSHVRAKNVIQTLNRYIALNRDHLFLSMGEFLVYTGVKWSLLPSM
jgi:hypothetical protein